MIKWLLLTLFILAGCNSEKPELGAIQGLRDPRNPIPYITSVSTIDAPQTYLLGNTITFDVAFSENVHVTGTPSIRVRTDDGVYQAYMISSTPNVLTFQYTVVAEQYDTDGIELVMPVLLNGGNITEPETGDTVLLTFTPPGLSGYLVHAATPRITTFTPPAVGTYGSGTTLTFQTTYNMPVNVTGSPYILIDVAGSLYFAYYVSGTGTTGLTYEMPTPPGKSGPVTVSSTSVDLNSGTIEDDFLITANNAIPATSMAGRNVDTVAPSVSPGTITVPANATYTIGQNLDFLVTFDEPVEIAGPAPSIAVTLNSGTVVANYHSGAGTGQLRFRYTVGPGNVDGDGIVVAASITNFESIEDPTGNVLASGTITVPSTTGVLVSASPPTITSITPPASGTYKNGNLLTFLVHFSANVAVTGTPTITWSIGGANIPVQYLTGSGTSILTFQYSLTAGREGGVSLVSTSIASGTIKDPVYGVDADRTLPGASYAGIVIDSKPPAVTSMSLPSNGTYYNGNTLNFVATFSENVVVNGTNPTITITLNTGSTTATYVSGSGSNTLTFSYTVMSGHDDNNGIALSASIANFGSIEDVNNNPMANGNFTAGSTTGILINGAPKITNFTTFSAPQTYGATNGTSFSIQVNFSEPISAVGTGVKLKVNMGGTEVLSDVCSVVTTYLTCVLNTVAGVDDTNGIDVIGFDMNGSNLWDGINNADLTYGFPVNFPGLKVDTIPPYVTGYNYITAGGASTSKTVYFQVLFNEPIVISGSPVIQLDLDGQVAYANIYTYSGNVAEARITLGATTTFKGIAHSGVINPSGGSIKDQSAGNVANYAVTDLDLSNHRVIPGGLTYWFDPNDSKTTTSVSGWPTSFKSITDSTLDGTLYGTPTFGSVNGKRVLNVGAGKNILLPTLSSEIYYIALVWKSGAFGTTGEVLMDLSTGNFKLDFDALGDVSFGSACSNNCYYYRNNTNTELIGSGGSGFTAIPDQFYYTVLSLDNANIMAAQLQIARLGWSGGQIGDFMIFTGNTMTDAIRSQIKDYVDWKYGAGTVIYPQP